MTIMPVSAVICMQTLLLVNSATLIQIEGWTPKGGHIPMPGTCDYVTLHGRGELSLQMGLSLLNNRQGIILDYLCSVSQLCLMLCDPMDCSPPGPSVHGIFKARILELPFPFPGNIPDPEVKPMSPASLALAGRFFITEPSGKFFELSRWAQFNHKSTEKWKRQGRDQNQRVRHENGNKVRESLGGCL